MPIGAFTAISNYTIQSPAMKYLQISDLPQNYKDIYIVITGVLDGAYSYIRCGYNTGNWGSNSGNRVSYMAHFASSTDGAATGTFAGTQGFTGLAGAGTGNQATIQFS